MRILPQSAAFSLKVIPSVLTAKIILCALANYRRHSLSTRLIRASSTLGLHLVTTGRSPPSLAFPALHVLKSSIVSLRLCDLFPSVQTQWPTTGILVSRQRR